MKLNNKKCIVCGTTYTYCPNCAGYKDLPKWMAMFHDENCHNVFNGICAYTLSEDMDKAKEILGACDLSVVTKMAEKDQNYVREIMGADAVPVVEVAAEVEEEPVEEVKENTAASTLANVFKKKN